MIIIGLEGAVDASHEHRKPNTRKSGSSMKVSLVISKAILASADLF